MVKLQVVSDTHLEFKNNRYHLKDIPIKGEILALLGDIGFPSDDFYKEYIKKHSSNFNKVFVVAGNHEFYGGEYFERKEMINKFCSKMKNVHFLDDSSFLLEKENICFFGSTLWTSIPKKEMHDIWYRMNDYRMIDIKFNGQKKRKLTPMDTNKFFEETKKKLAKKIKECQKKKQTLVCLSHHSPTIDLKTIFPKEKNILHALGSKLLLDGKKIQYWFYGHTHLSSDLELNGTILKSNQVGYLPSEREKSRFDYNFVTEVLHKK